MNYNLQIHSIAMQTADNTLFCSIFNHSTSRKNSRYIPEGSYSAVVSGSLFSFDSRFNFD